jgi:hypothetical protein
MDATAVVFSFGKFKGQPLTEVMTSYLVWSVAEIGVTRLNEITANLGSAVLAELARRGVETGDALPDPAVVLQAEHQSRRQKVQRQMAEAGWTRRRSNRKVGVEDVAPSVN